MAHPVYTTWNVPATPLLLPPLTTHSETTKHNKQHMPLGDIIADCGGTFVENDAAAAAVLTAVVVVAYRIICQQLIIVGGRNETAVRILPSAPQ